MIRLVTSFRRKMSVRKQTGSLALEQILFIGAVVAMSAGVWAFYDDIGAYFTNFAVADAPQNFGARN